MEALSRISQKKQDEDIRRSLEFGLEAADSVIDRKISLFSRGHQPAFAGINTFMKAPYCEDIRKIGDTRRPLSAHRSTRPRLTDQEPALVLRRCAASQPFMTATGLMAGRYLRGARSLRRRRHLRYSRQHREDLRPGDQGSVAYLYFRRVSYHLRRRPQPRFSECSGDRSAHRRQRGHHPHRSTHRYSGKGYG